MRRFVDRKLDDSVDIDLCGKCGGVFLDRGELDRIVKGEIKIDRLLRSRGQRNVG